MTEASRPPAFNFTAHPSTSPFAVSKKTYMSNNPTAKYNAIATGALVFDDSNASTLRILLVQRSAHDTMPSRWEFPGGGVDDDDESILHAVARELWEEAGLSAASIGPLAAEPHFFASRSGKQLCKFDFLVEGKKTDGKLDVKLDPKEHQRFVWASEEETRAGKAGDVELVFTSTDLKATMLEAFRIRRKAKGTLESI